MKYSEYTAMRADLARAAHRWHAVKPQSEWSTRVSSDTINEWGRGEPYRVEAVRKASTIRSAANYNEGVLVPHRKAVEKEVRRLTKEIAEAIGMGGEYFDYPTPRSETEESKEEMIRRIDRIFYLDNRTVRLVVNQDGEDFYTINHFGWKFDKIPPNARWEKLPNGQYLVDFDPFESE